MEYPFPSFSLNWSFLGFLIYTVPWCSNKYLSLSPHYFTFELNQAGKLPITETGRYFIFRHSGDNGCGGSCGTCKANHPHLCNGGQCACQTNCLGRQCGDDGCGGVCGTYGADSNVTMLVYVMLYS